jgi:hypothetical protein
VDSAEKDPRCMKIQLSLSKEAIVMYLVIAAIYIVRYAAARKAEDEYAILELLLVASYILAFLGL